MRLTATAAALLFLALACNEERTREGAVPPPPLTSPETGDAQTGATAKDPPVAPPDSVRDVRGVVARADAERIVIRPEEGEPVALRIVPGIPITVDGRVSAATRIREGAPVQAAYTFEGGEARALRIEVGRPAD